MVKKTTKKTTQPQTDFWEDTINLRNCTLGFECKQDWYRLLETKDENIKYCKQCEKSVYMIHNDTDLMDAIRGNRCVEFKAKSAIKNDAPCKIFAINNDIVWDDKAKDAKFQ